MAKKHVMTAARKAALKKAQRESALRRKHGKKYINRKTRKSNRRKAKIAFAVGAAVQVGVSAGLMYADHVSAKKARFKSGSNKIREYPGKHFNHRRGKTTARPGHLIYKTRRPHYAAKMRR